MRTYQRFALYTLLSALYFAPLLVRPSDCVFGIHDWSYPCYAEQGRNLLTSIFSPLSTVGLGGPNPRATNNPFVFLAFGLAAFSPAFALRVFLLAALALAGVAADIAASRVFSIRSDVARLVTGLMYVASPFFATKLVSGHLYFFLCAPLVPLAFVAAESVPAAGRRAWAGVAACIAGTLAQLQVGAALLVALAIVSVRRVNFVLAVAAGLVAIATFVPTIFSGVSAYSLGALSTETQLLEWVRQNSIPLGHVLDGTSYFARYYEAYAGVWTMRLWQAVSLVCVLVAASRGGAPRRLAIAAVVLGVVASGTRGPLSGLTIWVFSHVPAASAFRELYDLLAIAPLVVAGGAGIAFEWILQQQWSIKLKIAATAASLLAGAGCMWPAAGAVAARALPLASPGAWSSLVQMVDMQWFTGRVLWLPSEIPVGPPNSFGGADPFLIAIREHPAANEYHPDGILAYASAYADRNGSLPSDLARRLGIADVIGRPGLVSAALRTAAFGFQQSIEPPLRNPEVIPGAGPIAVIQTEPACLPALRSRMLDDVPYADCSRDWTLAPKESLDNRDDPRHEWVSGQRWAALDFHLVEPRWPVLFTLSPLPYTWRTPAPGFVWVYIRGRATLDGKSIAAGGWMEHPIGRGEHALLGDGNSIVAVTASVAWPEPRPAAPALPQNAAVTPVHVNRAFGAYGALLSPHMPAVLILRERWSPYWSAQLDGVVLPKPWRVDDYATAWSLPASARQSALSIRYSAMTTYVVLAALSWLIWIWLFIALVLPQRRARNP